MPDICPICTEIYMDPRKLSCSHTCCMAYIESISRKMHIQCPVCENMYRIPNVGFSPDINMMSFLTLNEVCKLILYKQPTYQSHQD